MCAVSFALVCWSRLAPLLPLLLPLFKQQHGDRAPAVARLEMLLYLTTKSLYPADRVMLPTSVTTAAAAAAKENPPATVDAVRSFIAAQQAAESAGQSAPSPAVAPSAARFERVSSFPFLPLGVAPGDVDSPAALLEDGSYLPFPIAHSGRRCSAKSGGSVCVQCAHNYSFFVCLLLARSCCLLRMAGPPGATGSCRRGCTPACCRRQCGGAGRFIGGCLLAAGQRADG